jgi:hypothetical protein
MTLRLYERAIQAERERDVLEDAILEALEMTRDYDLRDALADRLHRGLADVQRIRDEAQRDAADPAREDDRRISEADSLGERGRM